MHPHANIKCDPSGKLLGHHMWDLHFVDPAFQLNLFHLIQQKVGQHNSISGKIYGPVASCLVAISSPKLRYISPIILLIFFCNGQLLLHG